MLLSIDQPTTLREKASMTAAQLTFPSLVGCSVMSVHQISSGLDDEVPVDQVEVGLGLQVTHGAAAPAAPVEALDPGLAHQPCDSLVVDHHAEPEGELGVHPVPVRPVQTWSWVGAAEHGDLVAQHEKRYRGRRTWAPPSRAIRTIAMIASPVYLPATSCSGAHDPTRPRVSPMPKPLAVRRFLLYALSGGARWWGLWASAFVAHGRSNPGEHRSRYGPRPRSEGGG